jgi:hypothetical protein
MVPNFTLNAWNPVTCVLSAIVLLLQPPQCMPLFSLSTLVSLPCDFKFSSFQTDQTFFKQRLSNKRSFFLQRSTTFRWISRYFGCLKKVMNGQWWCWWMLPECLKSETGVVSSSFCGLFWTGIDGVCSIGRSETLLEANSVSGITFGLYG